MHSNSTIDFRMTECFFTTAYLPRISVSLAEREMRSLQIGKSAKRSLEKMKLLKKLILGILISCSASTLQSQMENHLRKEIEKIIRYETEISFESVPGFLVGIIDKDSTYILAFGSRRKGSAESLTDSSIFEIGGLSKIFSALLFHILQGEGFVDRHDPVNKYLKEDEINPALSTLTLDQLLTHTSGLPTLPTNLGIKEKETTSRYAQYSKNDLLDYYRQLDREMKSGKYIYSHTNYALLEIVFERATGQPFAKLVREKIFNPLQMTDSGIEISEGQMSRLTPGYTRAGMVARPWDFASFTASEGIKSSARDLCRFVSVMLHEALPMANSLKEMLKPAHKIPNLKKTFVADAWHVFVNRKYPNIYLHSGKTDGHAASIHFIRESKKGVVLLTNATGQMDGLAVLILRMINLNWKNQ